MKKLKVAIFGDSYVDELADTPEEKLKSNMPWVRILKKMSPHDITNFGILGSSLQYSAKLFFDLHDKFDKIIFVSTFPGRMHLTNTDVDPFFKHIANLEHLFYRVGLYKEYIEIGAFDAKPKKLEDAMPVLDALRDYYLYLYDYEQIKMFHDALYEKIERTVPKEKLLMMPVVAWAAPDGYTETTFSDISSLDNRPVNVTTLDNRQNHINRRNREILANKVNNWINTGEIDLSISHFSKPEEPFDELFTIMDTPKDFKK
jgi:hypothetical protein